jgi:DNA-directed RNA polymerase subunit delta
VPILSLAKYSKEELKELSLIEMTFEYFTNRKAPVAFNELMKDIQKASGKSEKEIKSRIAQFYTDMNVDGRFLSLGDNRWGLRVWYPVDAVVEEVAPVIKPKKKKAKKVVDEEEFDEIEEEDDFDEVDVFAEEDELLDEEDDIDLDEVDEFDEDDDEDVIDVIDVIDDEEVLKLDEEVELEDDLEEKEEDEDEEE